MNIYEALGCVMKDCTAVGKDSKNPQQGYKYRGIDAVMNAVNPALTKNHVFVAPEVLETSREERTTGKGTLLIYSIAKVRYTFYAEDGSSVTAVVIGEGMDSGDKSMNKAMSAAFKYALFQVLCIPTEEMIDSEIDSPEPQAAPQKKPAIKSDGYTVEKGGEKISPAQAANLKEVCKNHNMPEEKLASMYGKDSIEAMTVGDWAEFRKNGEKLLKEWDEQQIAAATQEPIGSRAGIELSMLLKRKGVNIEKLCEQKGVKSLSELTGEQYTGIIKQLEKTA